LGNLKYLPLVSIALALNVANVVGYSRCRKDSRKRFEAWVARETVGMIAKNPEFVTAAAVSSVGSVREAFTSTFTPHVQSKPQQQQQQQQPFYTPYVQPLLHPFVPTSQYASQYGAATTV
jgi:hypothetical protein